MAAPAIVLELVDKRLLLRPLMERHRPDNIGMVAQLLCASAQNLSYQISASRMLRRIAAPKYFGAAISLVALRQLWG
jgi:hypothetical protein